MDNFPKKKRMDGNPPLRFSERSFMAIFQAAPIPMSYAPMSGELLVAHWNDAWYQVFGYDREQVEGHGGGTIGMWCDMAERTRFIELLQAGTPAEGQLTGSIASLQAWLNLSDGSRRLFEINGRYVENDGDRLLLTSYQDLSERMAAEHRLRDSEAELQLRVEQRTLELAQRNQQLERSREQLQLSEQRLSHIFELTGEGIWDFDLRTGLTQVSPRWLSLFGYPPGSPACISRQDYAQRHVLPEATPVLQEAFEACLSGRRAMNYELRLRRLDGSLVWMQTRGDVTERDAAGLPVRLMGSTVDIDVRKNAELALIKAKDTAEATNAELAQALATLQRAQDELVRAEKLASLGALVAGVAHELNTPIGNAVMMASTLIDRQRDFDAAAAAGLRRSTLDAFLADSRQAAEMIARSLGRAAELVRSFKQVAVDQSSYQRRRFGLHEVSYEIALTLQPSLRKAGVQMRVDVDTALEMDSCPGPLGQVLMNLVNNALLHAFEGRPDGRIEISAAPLPLRPGWLHLTVADNGCGIAAAHLPRVFDPFFTTKLGQGGSGLGLHIVYSLVTGLLGGQVELHSAPGQGTRVTINLPLEAPNLDPLAVLN